MKASTSQNGMVHSHRPQIECAGWHNSLALEIAGESGNTRVAFLIAAFPY